MIACLRCVTVCLAAASLPALASAGDAPLPPGSGGCQSPDSPSYTHAGYLGWKRYRGTDVPRSPGFFDGPGSNEAFADGLHVRYPYYNYRAPWYSRGPASRQVTIVW